jgi:hypothetical protein
MTFCLAGSLVSTKKSTAVTSSFAGYLSLSMTCSSIPFELALIEDDVDAS